MFGSILVPLDGSAYAEQALGAALRIARTSGGELTLCRVHNAMERSPTGSTIEDVTAVQSHAAEYMGVRSRRLSEQLGRPVDQRIEVGSPATVLTQVAGEIGADLLVLTTHGHGGLSHRWLGGTVEGLVRQAARPLLLMRPGVHDRGDAPEMRRILVPLDGSTTAEMVLTTAREFAGLFEADVQLLAIVELPVELPARVGEEPIHLSGASDPEEERIQAGQYLEKIATGLRARGLSVETEVRMAIGVASAILQAAAEFDTDVIAMATHGRTRLRRLTVGSVSDKVIRAAGVPVLLVPSREGETKGLRSPAAAAAAEA